MVGDGTAMSECGFLVEELGSVKAYAKMPVSSDIVSQQDEAALRFDALLWEVAFRRMLSLQRGALLPPRSFALLLVSGPTRDWYLKGLQVQWEAYQEAKSLGSLVWRNILARSPFSWTLVADVLQHLAANAWAVSGELEGFLTRLFSNFCSTCPVEVSFQKTRQAEHDRADRVISDSMCWQHPVNRQSLSKDFGFTEVSPESVPALHGTRLLLASLFAAPSRRCSVPEYKALATTASKPPNPTFAAHSSMQLLDDLKLAEFLGQSGRLGEASKAWRSQLLVPGLLVFSPKVIPKQVFFSMGVYSTCCCLWPAKRVARGSTGYYEPVRPTTWSELVWAPVLDFSGWLVMPVEAVSPAHTFCLDGHKFCLPLLQSNRLQVEKRPRPLLEVVAERAFFSLKADFLDKVATDEYGLEISGQNFPEKKCCSWSLLCLGATRFGRRRFWSRGVCRPSAKVSQSRFWMHKRPST